MIDSSGWLHNGPLAPRLLLAHGAGAPMDSEFMNLMTGLLVERGIGVLRFEFPYMAERRHTGKKRPPDGQVRLLDCWRQVIETQADDQPLIIGGKSMGGRMATLLAAELESEQRAAAGIVCLGYPFHPPGKPERLRTEHLQTLQTPVLMVQGTRDPMGNKEEVGHYGLSKSIEWCWLEDGNHDLKPRVKSGFTHAAHLQCAADAIAAFIRRVSTATD